MPFGVKLNKKGNTDMKKVLTMKNYRVMKNYMKYICAFLMLLGIHVNAWGTTESMDFSSSTWAWPQGVNAYETTHTKGAHQVIVKYAQEQTTVGVMLSSKSHDAYMLLPAFPGTVSSITIATCSGSASNQVINLYDNSTNDLLATTTITTGGDSYTFTTGTKSYNLPYSGVSSGTIIRIEGDGVNVQLSSISVTHNGSAMPTIDVDDYVLNMSATTIRGTLEDGEITAEVPFSVTINNPAYGYPIIYFALEDISPSSDLTLYSMSHIDENGWWDSPDPDEWNMYKYSDYEDPWVSYTERFSFTYYCVEAGTYTAKFRLYDEEINVLAEASLTFVITEPCTDRSITMSDFSKDFGSADFVPTHTVSAGSGTKTWTSSNTDVATIVDGKVHIVASGTTTIGLTVATDDTYCEVSQSCTMTVNALVPTVTAFTVTSTTPTSITLTNAQVSNKGGAAITAYGYIYSTTASTTEALKLGESGVSTATVASADIAASTNFASKTVSELTTGTTYYVRAYATNSAGTGYSAIQSVKTIAYTDYKFSCADWSLTGPSGDIVFITSAASKTVRSQEAFHVSGNGLPHSTALTFTTFPVNTKFEFKKADGTIPQTNEFGVVDADVYVFYTPDAGDTSDGLDELTSLTVSVEGEPRTATIDTKRIIGRHLPADFVIAAKYNKKWYALPADMNELSNPIPVEIAVDDSENPTVAYTANTNIYNLYGQNTGAGGKLYTDGQTVKLGMKNNSNKPLFASTTGTYTIKGDGNATVTNNISSQYWWTLRQTNTSITNCQDAKYEVKPSANDRPLMAWFADGGYKWGLYPAKGAKGIEELRLIPASDIVFTEAYFVEWAQHGGVVEVDAQGVAATSVVAHLNGASSAAITLVQTKASDAKNKSSKYNYTVNFGNGIDFAAAASNGALLRLEWKNGATVKAMTSLVVPKIIAASSTLSSHGATDGDWSSAEVHVLPGVTLTANAGDFSSNDVLINHLEIYPGATVKVTKGEAESGTLKVKTLVLRNGWTRASGKEYDVARLYITPSTASMAKNAVSDVWYSDWYIDYDQYYPVAVPWDVTLSGITYRYCSVEPSVGPSKNIRLKYYDGESRATNVQEGVGSGANWKTYGDAGCTDVPTKLEPSKGYAMTAKRPTGKAFSIIRMPLTIPNASWTTAGEQGEVSGTHKDQVSVTAWGTGSTPTYAQGWNLIANPYMSLHQGAITYTGSGTTVRYVNIPDVDFKEYDQFATATAMLKPASAFLIQAPETGTITFGTENRKASAPSYRTEEKPESIPEQQAYIVLSNEQSEDMMGLLVADKFTEAYETNADLEKLLSDGNTLRTYMRYGDMNMAYVAINEMLAKEWIPVSVRIPADGEYTFSLHEASKVSELEGVYLIDYANGDHVTNLIEQSYTFSSTAGTINGRFSINAKTGERQTPTGIDAINAGGDLNSDKPFKFIYHDKVYIWLNGVIYDTTGKRVK